MAEKMKGDEELDQLFRDFDDKHSELQQKFLEVEKNLEEFRKEKSETAGDEPEEVPTP